MASFSLKKIFGTKNEREIKKYLPVVDRTNSLEDGISRLSDTALRGRTDEFRKRLSGGETLDDILPEAFAVVREAAKRAVGMRHFDVQLIGGLVLHNGKIAEMKTGEGKTLVATLPVYLNALEGKGVHVVTVNDYLAKRDAGWMGPVYDMLGLKTGVIVHDLSDEQRQQNYAADITYGTNNEFGFDYLRDNMKYDIGQYVQRGLNYAIVDEVDSILIDEARTPLIISGPSEESTDKYYKINRIIPSLKQEADFTLEEKTKSVVLTDEGNSKTERLLGLGNLYDQSNIEIVHHVLQGLRAHHMYKRDVDYVVKDGEVVIVDEFTGRLMPGRRWSDGLHQAIEAKEGVKIESENQTLATITFQNYFRMYGKLAGMTGTADTEAAEFGKIYNLDVTVVPTHKPMIRKDHQDAIYKNEQAKFRAIIREIESLHEKGQPVLVGTISIEKSETLSQMLRKKGIPHSVLNAKYHEREAEIIAQAGRSSAVTIATNMAGRGTDIILGGNPEGVAREILGDRKSPDAAELAAARKKAAERCEADRNKVIGADGLVIIGTERHESRRIDNQLRGRSGRQGDPGASRFYLSLEDDLMRIFGSDRLHNIMDKLGMEEDVPIENRMVSKAVENAQKRVEEHNFDIRKHLIEYDDVMNSQRTEIYSFRREILSGGENLRERIQAMMEDAVDDLLDVYCPEDKHPTQWDIKALKDAFYGNFAITAGVEPESTAAVLREALLSSLRDFYAAREKEVGRETMEYIEKVILLQIVDSQWKDHLLAMDHLREGIGLRGYGQRDPLTEYKKEGFEMFGEMTNRINTETLSRLFKVRIQTENEVPKLEKQQRLIYNRGEGSGPQTMRKEKKIGRNEPCPCGSGKKYKKCCGANA
ncbi:MAG: preprotein translocase subunit SecA [Nitrospiraceae bacterium]|nr:preprotein translocase subunit SecA [Nitrospiraceae bacterium]